MHNSRWISVGGERHDLHGWARILGCSPSAIHRRIQKGMSPEEAVTKPLQVPRLIELNGDRLTARGWATRLGITESAISMRLKGGWTIEKALTFRKGEAEERVAQSLIGQRFFRLIVLEDAGVTAAHHRRYLCRCDCGNVKLVNASFLKNGSVKSCGCWRHDVHRKHGQGTRQGRTPEYRIWRAMIQRCYLTTNNRYTDYGGRGITVCQEWRDLFATFFADMGPRPDPKLTLDRIDNDGQYCKANCRWASRREQRLNQRPRQYRSLRYKSVREAA